MREPIDEMTESVKKLSNELAKKTEYFGWMLDEYDGNIYVSDLETYELFFMNRTGCNTLQMSSESILGKKCYEILQGRTTPCPFCTNPLLSENSFYEWEFFNPVLERNFLIKNRIIEWNGRRARIELSHDMYSAEYKLAKKDQERDNLLRTIPGGFARIDARNFRSVLWYAADFLDLIGYTQEQFETELHSEFNYIHPDDVGHMLAAMEHTKESGHNKVIEARVVTHGGEIRTLTITLSYVSGEESWDGIPSFYSVGIDITGAREEQMRQRKALEDAFQALSVANSAKTDFLSAMSHDIRTPMNAIVGMTTIA